MLSLYSLDYSEFKSMERKKYNMFKTIYEAKLHFDATSFVFIFFALYNISEILLEAGFCA